jgi:hypothetical protein
MIVLVETSAGAVPFEVDEGLSNRPPQSTVRSLTPREPDQIAQNLHQALQAVCRVAEEARAVLSKVNFDSAELTVAVKLTAEAGFVIAKTSAEGSINLKIKLVGSKTED